MDGRSVHLFLLLIGLLERSWQLDPPISEDGDLTSDALEELSGSGFSVQGGEIDDSFRLENSNSTNSNPSENAFNTSKLSDNIPPASVKDLFEDNFGEDERIMSAAKVNQSVATNGNKVKSEMIIPVNDVSSAHIGNGTAGEVFNNINVSVQNTMRKDDDIKPFQPRGDTDPLDSSSNHVEIKLNKSRNNDEFEATTEEIQMLASEADIVDFDTDESKDIVEDQLKAGFQEDIAYSNDGNFSVRLATVIKSQVPSSSMSWLDALMLHHRGTFFIIINTIFMVVWIIVGILSLYRLLGLPWCSPYVSRTQYLVIHLLIFTASTFEFVQLIHLCFGSHKGLPLFLTLLLTHTPTPCLAVSLIIMTYCIFASTRVPVFGSYFPPLIYVSILAAFIIVFSFVGDIIVGISRNSIFLIIIRAVLIGLCIVCLLSFVFNYRKITGVALIMRREFRGELKALAIPVNSPEDNQDARLHLKKMLLSWTRLTLLSCISGILMCVFSFCLSLFFTVSFVPLWAFWVLHSAIFLSQIIVVFSLTFGAAFTLMYNSRRNIVFKYFLPSFLNGAANNGPFIKRGNFIYQRVSVSNGPIETSISPPPTILENEEQGALRNNNLISELTSSPYRSKVNLKRSATFNCASPYGFHHPNGPPFPPNLYPVLSDHILPYSYSQLYPDFIRHDINDSSYEGGCRKPTLQVSSSFNYPVPNREHYRHSAYARRYPYKGFHVSETHPELAVIPNRPIHKGMNISAPVQGSSTPVNPNSYGLAGTVEALDVKYHPLGIVPVKPEDRNMLRQIPRNHSFARKEPPEKPARKTEPILVKGVLKDNVNLEMALPTKGPIQDTKANPYSLHKNSNVYFPEKGFLRDKSQLTSLGTPPNVKKFPEAANSSYGRSNTDKLPVPSILYQNKEVTSPSVSPITSSNVSLAASPSNSSPDKSTLEKKFLQNKELESDTNSSVTQHNINLTWKQDKNLEGKDDNDLNKNHALDFIPIIDSTSKLHPPKQTSLKRNHSTAGEFSPRKTPVDAESETISMAASLDSNGLNKYPWYGTWGGRRRSKKKISTMGHDNTSGSTLSRLSASKSSLSSIYERLKPKKNKSPKTKDCHNLSFDAPEDDDEMEKSAVDDPSEEEEEEELLPRLDEDIDLASEIFRSSTVLADFYSLDRSFLKKRKKERLNKQNNDGKSDHNNSECNENGVVSSADDDSYKSLNSNLEEKT